MYVCTFNSGKTIGNCLTSIVKNSEGSKIVVVDHHSSDDTREICSEFGVELVDENVGLGRARQICFDRCTTRFLAFVDSDVEIIESLFFKRAHDALDDPETGAVVGMAIGHRFAYGLPASLLVLRNSDFAGFSIPEYIDSRETYFIQHRLDERRLRTVYLADAMIHRSGYRKMKPEWEGANTRLAVGWSVQELIFALRVMVLMSLNSRSVKNKMYVPVFFLKFIRGFTDPSRFRTLERSSEDK